MSGEAATGGAATAKVTSDHHHNGSDGGGQSARRASNSEIVVSSSQAKRPTLVQQQQQQQHSNSKRISPPAEEAEQLAIRRTSQREETNKPLIHTDHLSASSPLLHVRAPSHHHQLAARLQQQSKEPLWTSESVASQRRASIMAASPSPPSHELVARLVVLDLQVTSSSASLTWSLALHPADAVNSEPPTTTGGERRGLEEEEANKRQQRRTSSQRAAAAAAAIELTHNNSNNNNNKTGDKIIRAKRDNSISSIRGATLNQHNNATSTTTTTTTDLSGSPTTRANREQKQTTAVDDLSLPLVANGGNNSNSLLNRLALDLGRPLQDQLPPTTPTQLSQQQQQPYGGQSGVPEVATTTTSQQRQSPPATRRRHQRPPGRQLAMTQASQAAQLQQRPEPEPPMIRRPSVALNRIAPTTSAPSGDQPTRSSPNNTTVVPPVQPDPLTTASSTIKSVGATITSTTTPSPPTTTTTTTTQTSPTIAITSTTTTTTTTTTTPKPPQPRTEPTRVPSEQQVPSITPEAASPGDVRSLKEPSKWLVRLRRFGSNEVDIVKVVVNNLRLVDWEMNHLRRYIVFNGLEPESGYELCVESGSPNQQVGDRHQILDANHYLKCHDTSDVELANATQQLKRSTSEEAADSATLAATSRIKSLCKEFFTLPANSSDTLTFGPPPASASTSTSAKVGERGLASLSLKAPTGGSDSQQEQSAPSRRPKSLNNALHSRMELLEINDLGGGGGGTDGKREPATFEVLASRASAIAHHHHNHQQPSGRLAPAEGQLVPSGGGAPRLYPMPPLPALEGPPQIGGSGLTGQPDYLSLSLLPIVGCVFALIFIVTLANILLSAVTCARRPPLPAAAHHQRRSRHHHQRHQRPLTGAGGYYSDSHSSNQSAGSQARMVAGSHHSKNQEPFVASSAYFEVPSARNSSRGSHSSAAAGPDVNLGSNNSHLLARFPLGPSFEGDGRHNADMVGLARKNYDNFIQSMYNSSDARGPPPARHARTPDGYDACTPEVGSTEANERSATDHPRQRLRFDKINPIYNMELAAATCQRLRSPVSTFGHSPQADSSQSSNPREPSPPPPPPPPPPPVATETTTQLPSRSQSADAAQLGGESPDCALCYRQELEEPSFTCCLDRQKQRFERQQEQLGRVLTKSGSLLPQPFIHPAGPLRCPGSPTCQAAAATDGPEASMDDSLASSNASNSQASLAQNQADASDQLERDNQELISPSAAAAATATGAKGPAAYLMFGDTQAAARDAAPNLESGANQVQAQEKKAAPAKGSTLVVSVEPAANSVQKEHQAMNKRDFDQRRNELASKLHLAGMSRPG